MPYVPMPPVVLAQVDQETAELDRRLRNLVRGARAITEQREIPDMAVFMAIAAGLRTAVRSDEDQNTVQLMLAMAIVRLAVTDYGRP